MCVSGSVCCVVPVSAFSHSAMSDSLQPPLSMGFSRQERSGLPCPPPRDLPNPGMEPRSPTSI